MFGARQERRNAGPISRPQYTTPPTHRLLRVIVPSSNTPVLQKPNTTLFYFVNKVESAEPPWRLVSCGAVPLFPDSSACCWDPKFRQPAIELLVLVLLPGTIASRFQARYRSLTERSRANSGVRS